MHNSLRSRCFHSYPAIAHRIGAALVLAVSTVSVAQPAPMATTTQLSIPVATAGVGVPTLMTATVTDASSNPVLRGTVTFYRGTQLLGSAQIVSQAGGRFTQGTANLKTASFAPGVNSITAVFAGTAADLPSTSAAQTVTVTGQEPTATTLSAPPSNGTFNLTAALQAYGIGTPTGTLEFLNSTTNTPFGSLPLSGAAWFGDFAVSNSGPNNAQAIGDFNEDGFLDAASAITSSGVGIQLGNGDGTFQNAKYFPIAGLSENAVDASIALISGDFHNNGSQDLVLSLSSRYDPPSWQQDLVAIEAGNGDGTFQPAVQVGQYGACTCEFLSGGTAVGDFNRDGNLDLAVGSQNGSLFILLGNGDGTFQPPQETNPNLEQGPGEGPITIAVGDINGDGIPDLVVAQILAGSAGMGVLIGVGDGTFAPAPGLLFHPTNGFALGDVNGDGKLDLVYSDAEAAYSNASGSSVNVALGNGDGTFAAPIVYPFSGAPGSPVIADINQDGKPDIALTTNSAIEVLLGNGDGTFQPAQQYADEGADSITGDFNGDGRPDLLTSSGVALNQQTATLQLAAVALPSVGPTLAQASYSGDPSFAPNASNLVTLLNLQLNGGATISGNQFQMTNEGFNEASSAYTSSPVNVQSFTTDFTFQISNPGSDDGNPPPADGFTFTIQNAGATAVGGLGGGLGYNGLPSSVAVKFDIFNNVGEGADSTGVFIDGAFPGLPAIDLTQTGIVLGPPAGGCGIYGCGDGPPPTIPTSGNPIRAHITYDGTNLAVTLTDTVTAASFAYAYPIDIPATVGGPTAYVGFTASTGGYASTQDISGWTYTAGPPATSPISYPAGFSSALGLSLNGIAILRYGGIALTNQNSYTAFPTPVLDAAGSAFYTAPQNIQGFTTDFTFQISNPYSLSGLLGAADGFTFTIQNQAPNALGGVGGSLGYLGIPASVAVKFDLYDNIGEGPNSIGLFTEGAFPGLPAIDLTPSGIDLHSGDVMQAHITYDGTNLALTLTDTITSASFSTSWPIGIPAVVGGTTAYVGFTGSTGALTANQSIDSWTFVAGTPQAAAALEHTVP